MTNLDEEICGGFRSVISGLLAMAWSETSMSMDFGCNLVILILFCLKCDLCDISDRDKTVSQGACRQTREEKGTC